VTGRSVSPDVTRLVYIALHNRAVESFIVYFIALLFMITRFVDATLHISLQKWLIGRLRKSSKGRPGNLRRAQLRHIIRNRYGLSGISIRLAEGAYWISMPCIIKGSGKGGVVRYFAKVMDEQSAMKHRYMNRLRNMVADSLGLDVRFSDYSGPRDMAAFEKEMLDRMRAEGVDAPEAYGIHRISGGRVIVMEHIAGTPVSGPCMKNAFASLRKMHDAGLYHGDVKADNFICTERKAYLLDPLKMDDRGDRKRFDLACALTSFSMSSPVNAVVDAALRYYTSEDLLGSTRYIEYALRRADINLPEEKAKELKVLIQ
jgi:tRNA A-37 threonylcarbamoyl transferase component Bud32